MKVEQMLLLVIELPNSKDLVGKGYLILSQNLSAAHGRTTVAPIICITVKAVVFPVVAWM